MLLCTEISLRKINIACVSSVQIFVSTETYSDADNDQRGCRQGKPGLKEVKRIANIARRLKQEHCTKMDLYNDVKLLRIS